MPIKLGRRCTICTHKRRTTIEAAMARGDSLRAIESRFELSRTTVKLHLSKHLPSAFEAAVVARPAELNVRSGDALLDEVARLRGEAQRLGAQAEGQGDLRAALQAVREQTRIVELLAQLAEQATKNRPPTGDDVGIAGCSDQQLEVLAGLDSRPAASAQAIVETSATIVTQEAPDGL